MTISFPTTLNPWFVLFKYVGDVALADERKYYKEPLEGEIDPWVDDKKKALIFQSLVHAARIANTEDAEILVIYTRDQAVEYGRDKWR